MSDGLLFISILTLTATVADAAVPPFPPVRKRGASACLGLQIGENRNGIRPENDVRGEKSSVMLFCLRFSSSEAARKAGRCKIPQAALNRQKLGQHCYCRGKRKKREKRERERG